MKPETVRQKIEQVREQRLTELDLSNNWNAPEEEKLREIPAEVFELEWLQVLKLSYNQLSSLPEAISRLQNLFILDLSGNQLSSLPDAISCLENLSILNLSRNQLSSIPEAISRLQNLFILDLSRNQLRGIPEAITRLENLSVLDLRGNPLETPPIEVAERGIKAIRAYFREQLESVYEAKLIIVGEGAAGKTTLAKKIENPNYPVPAPEDSTHGIEVKEWHFKMEDGKDFRVNIWDFGGQEIYHATHQFFLTKRSLYLLVADSRKEQPHLDYWLNIVELLSDNSPLLIIKNEKDDRPLELDEPQLKSRFDQFLKQTFSTNFADNRGLEPIIKAIKYYITDLPIVGSKWPKTWTKVRAALEADERNYISLEEYFRICEDNGFTSPLLNGGPRGDKNTETTDSRLILSQFLHDIGVILHFQDSMILRKIVILKPEWGTKAAYAVLKNDENNIVKQNFGKFTDTDLLKIWHGDEYANMQVELLELMRRFKLCYPLPNAENTYIAPELLDTNKPEYPWNIDNNLMLRYEYEFMPKGIITRFIVEMHRYIDEPKVWRSGVILKREDALAEVIETYNRREIKIRLWGKNQRGLLEVIIDKLDEIHDSYYRLRVEKRIPCNCPVCHNQQEPHFYDYGELKDRVFHQKQTIECRQPPFHEVNVWTLIDDVIGREKFIRKEAEKERESRESGESKISYHFHGDIQDLDIQTSETGNNIMTEENNQPIKVKSAWANGLFYLFTFLVVVAAIGFFGGYLPLPVLCLVVIAAILFVPLIGALQLRQDDRLSEKSFLKLMQMVIGQLPLIGNILGNLLNPKP